MFLLVITPLTPPYQEQQEKKANAFLIWFCYKREVPIDIVYDN